ncbi:HET-domain-containing protein [Stipitochalara longipes BDJ]|nr:HET-domain-containing protein [Stipitochalara longipes BDJ]
MSSDPSDSEDSSSESGSSLNAEECLGDKIIKQFEKSAFDKEDFLPDGCIDTLITKTAVIKELALTQEDLKKESNQKLVNFILKKGKKIFATMLVAGFKGTQLNKAMTQFRKNKLGDSILPITEETKSNIPFFGNDPTRSWGPVSVHGFCRVQRAFLSPVFSKERLNLELHADVILPFTYQEDDVKSGAFGEVHQVTVHPSHHKDPVLAFDGQRSNVAIKEIKQVHTDDKEEQRELDEAWKREVKAHIDIDKLQHPHIIEFIAAVTRGKRYLMFRWADGGNLRDFWQSNNKPQICVSLVRDVVNQIRGIADALDRLHSYGGGGGSYRHGDIKPENILRVRTKSVTPPELDVGVLKIADLGLAKHHNVGTEFRPQTSMRYTTYRYEPPEARPGVSTTLGRSKRQDIWSIGCVTLEFIIWLLYGAVALAEFNDKLVGDMKESSPYFEIEVKGGKKTARVHTAVNDTMDALLRDQECRLEEGSAIKDLIGIVRTKLLVVNLGAVTVNGRAAASSPPNHSSTQVGFRASAPELVIALDNIIAKGEKNERYWYTGKPRGHLVRLPKTPSQAPESLLSPDSAHGQGIPTRQKEPMPPPPEDLTFVVPSVTQRFKDEYRNAAQIDKTNFPVDNKFASELVKTIGVGLFPKDAASTRLCDDCKKFDFFEPQFHIKDTWAKLEEKTKICSFCKMRLEVAQHFLANNVSTIRFDRDQSMLKLNESQIPVMSICRSSEVQTPNAHFIQIGLPKLPAVGSRPHFDILRQFLKNCDANHPKCPPPKTSPLPTRLIDLGTSEAPSILIYETKPGDSLPFIALSHPWGPGPDHFCTYRSNLDDYKKNISFDKLPATFQHAVTTTRELGLRYLWIDSICIIQGPDGDFAQEATRMEDVFSSAYCVLAASSAKGQKDGFLTPRKENGFITFEKSGQPVYVCQFMDDFKVHVLDGPLSKRGWVMQERALAHRTIFFTDTQTYWECGEGVRCETLTKMDNQLISFLGDPNFPSKISIDNSDRGERIRLYEDLYRQYSRLEFTRWYDRPIAIAGLEKRLIRDLNAQGGFGVFDDGRSLLQRSLLWRKGQEVSALERIAFPPERTIVVPSWSWMGYKGAIDYLDLPLGGVDWLPDVILSPWAEGGTESWHTGDDKGVVALSATAKVFKIGKQDEDNFGTFYDRNEPSKTEEKTLRCVVVGKRMVRAKTPANEITHYVLLIAPKKTESPRGEKVYERVGVGYMAGKFIDLVGTGAAGLVNVQ